MRKIEIGLITMILVVTTTSISVVITTEFEKYTNAVYESGFKDGEASAALLLEATRSALVSAARDETRADEMIEYHLEKMDVRPVVERQGNLIVRQRLDGRSEIDLRIDLSD